MDASIPCFQVKKKKKKNHMTTLGRFTGNMRQRTKAERKEFRMMIQATENDGAEMMETEIRGLWAVAGGEHEHSGSFSQFLYIFLMAR